MNLLISVCRRCELPVFPPQLVCRRCGSLEWDSLPERDGVLEHVTVLRRRLAHTAPGEEPRIGLIRTGRGPRIVARVDESARPGDRVSLSVDNGAAVAERAPGNVVQADATT